MDMRLSILCILSIEEAGVESIYSLPGNAVHFVNGGEGLDSIYSLYMGGCTNACICMGTHSQPLLPNRLMDVYETW